MCLLQARAVVLPAGISVFESKKSNIKVTDMKYLYPILVSLFCTLNTAAEVKLTAKAPSVVSVGEQFRLQYSINANVVAEPHIQPIPGIRVVYGPAISTSQSYQSINGHVSQSSSTSFTFTLVAEREGTFTLPDVTVNVGGKTYTSNKTRIKAVKTGNTNKATSSKRSTGQPYNTRANTVADYHKISPSELYITTTANKHEVYEQEPLLLSYNVYTNLMLEQLQGKMPDLKGFVAKEIPLSRDKHLTVTRHNGRTTQTTTWSQYVMFPQQSGKLTVPSIKFEGIVAFPDRNVDPIDAFFYGSNVVTRVSHTVNAPSVNITVKPLPESPVGFGGAVGHGFAISSKLLTKEIRENETFNLQVVISGTGNIDLISPPEVDFPADFEADPPTTSTKTELTADGLTGQLIINYSATPNHKGSFVIPPVKLVYFDPQDARYHTVSTGGAICINVKKGSPNSFAARQRLKNDDIRNIHLGNVKTGGNGSFWFGTSFWLANAVLVLMLLLQPMAIRSLSKIRKSGLSLIGRQDYGMKLPQSDGFKDNVPEYYKQLLAAFKRFIALRTHSFGTELGNGQVKELLHQYGVEEKDIADSMDFVENCERHTYGATNSTLAEMDDQKLVAQDLMQRLKKQLRGTKCRFNRHRQRPVGLLLIVLLAFLSTGAYCQSKTGADSLYLQHHYNEALQQYRLLLRENPNAPDLLYNTGNCYYRLKKFPEAILSYERSMRYNPADKDLRHNLTMARAHSADKFYSAADLELVYSFNSFANVLSMDGWAGVSVIALFAAVCFCLVCRLSRKKTLRKISAIAIVCSAVCIVLSNVFAYTQYRRYSDNSGAVIMTATPLRSTPDTTGGIMFTLHGGTKVTLTDTTLPTWSEVRLPDGRKGWILNKDKENI